jgi:hypothetical protein
MKTALTFILVAVSLNAASLGIEIPVRAVAHPVQSYRGSSKATIAMLAGSITLAGTNAADYATTRRGIFPGSHFGLCELNPLLRVSGSDCEIAVTRFTVIKAGIEAFSIAQWIPVWTGHAGDRYKTTMTIIDFGMSVPLGIADAGNFRALRKYGAL